MVSIINKCNNSKESFDFFIVFLHNMHLTIYLPHVHKKTKRTRQNKNLEDLLARINIICIHKKLIMSLNDIQLYRAR